MVLVMVAALVRAILWGSATLRIWGPAWVATAADVRRGFESMVRLNADR
jgi:hypothetical protein